MQSLQAAGRSGGAVRRAALGRLGPRSALLRVGTGPFQLTHQLLPCRSARRRQSAVLCAGVCGHPVAQVGTGEGADAVAALEGDASFAGHCRDQRGHLHHSILHQRCGRAAARRVPERPEGHPLPLVGGAHPQPVDAAVPAVAELQRIHAARRLYCAGGRKRELVFYHPETSFFDSADAFPAGALLPSHLPGQNAKRLPGAVNNHCLSFQSFLVPYGSISLLRSQQILRNSRKLVRKRAENRALPLSQAKKRPGPCAYTSARAGGI